MLPVEEITKSLPPPREDEPSSLRQDIVDEILDHLQCGLRRELLIHGDDAVIAKQRVLKKFGDPQQIARKLWFQAMWSKIMTQRLVIGSAIFSMLVSAILVGMVGWMMHQQQQVNAALIERMAKIVAQPSVPEPQRDLHWNNLQIKVTTGSEEGPAAEGSSIDVSKLPSIDKPQNNSSHHAVIGASGVEDCGFVEPGRYSVQVTTSWGEFTNKAFTVFPGQDHLEQIIAPQEIPETRKVSVNVNGIPDSFFQVTGRQTVLMILLTPVGTRKIAGLSWGSDGWLDGLQKSFLMYVPGHGIWYTEHPKSVATINIPFVARDSSWEPLTSSSELSVRAHEYSVEFSFFYRTGDDDVSPSDSNWQKGIDGSSLNAHWYLPSKVIAEVGKLNEWTITLPENVAKFLKDPTQFQGTGGGFF